MKIEIPDSAFEVLSKWASIGRTIDAAVSVLVDAGADDFLIEELLDLKQPLEYVNSACRERRRAPEVIEIEIYKEHFDVLSKWASVGRTINNAINLLINIDDTDYGTVDELEALRQPLDHINSVCKNKRNLNGRKNE